MQQREYKKRNRFFLMVGIMLVMVFFVIPQAKVYAYRAAYPGEIAHRNGFVVVNKVDENGDPLPGATFEITTYRYDENGQEFIDTNSGMPATVSTDEFYLSNKYLDNEEQDSVFSYEGENIARIELREVTAPEGYSGISQPIVLNYYYLADANDTRETIQPGSSGSSVAQNKTPNYYLYCELVDDGGADVTVEATSWFYNSGPLGWKVTIKNTPAEAKTNLNKYLVVDENAEIPNVTYSYTVSVPAQKIDPTDDTMVVYPGVTPNLVKVNNTAQTGTVVFNAGEATTAGALDGVASATEKYARKNLTLDFSACTFTEPGVYRYYVTEANKTSPFENDAEPVRTVDVYVEMNGNALEVAGFVSYYGTVTTAPKYDVDMSTWLTNNPKPVEADFDTDSSGLPLDTTEQQAYDSALETWQTAYNTEHERLVALVPNGVEASTPKSDKYVNKYLTEDLIVSKTVTGNQGSRDQYFAIKVTLRNAGNDAILNLDPTNSSFETSTLENEATSHAKADMDEANSRDDHSLKTGQQLVADENGLVEFTLYLHHGQQVQINGIAKGATYSVEEIDPAPGYTKSYENQTGTIVDEDVTSRVINNRGGVIPTGLITAALPGIVLVGGAAIYFLGKKKEEEEE